MGHGPDSVYLSLCDHQVHVLRGCCFELDKKHQGYYGVVVPAVAQGILCGGDLLASCDWVTCLSTRIL